MRKDLKELAELYALGAISLQQLAQGQDDMTWAEFNEILIYAEYYGGSYDQWVMDEEELMARDELDYLFADSIDERCYYSILCNRLIDKWNISGELSPFQFCLYNNIVPDDILDMYINDCAFE